MNLPKNTTLALCLSLHLVGCADDDDTCFISPGIWRIEATSDRPECPEVNKTLRIQSLDTFTGAPWHGAGCMTTTTGSHDPAACSVRTDVDCDGDTWTEKYTFDTPTTGSGSASDIPCTYDITLTWESE